VNFVSLFVAGMVAFWFFSRTGHRRGVEAIRRGTAAFYTWNLWLDFGVERA